MSPLRNPKPVDAETALARLEAQCAAAEMSTGEARQKLSRWGIAAGDAGCIVASLVERRFIDDSRFAGAFARDKFQFSGWGRIKIAIYLRQKGINDSDIAKALDSIDAGDYRRALQRAIARELNSGGGLYDDFEGRRCLARRFMSRGFEPSLVIEAIKSAASRT